MGRFQVHLRSPKILFLAPMSLVMGLTLTASAHSENKDQRAKKACEKTLQNPKGHSQPSFELQSPQWDSSLEKELKHLLWSSSDASRDLLRLKELELVQKVGRSKASALFKVLQDQWIQQEESNLKKKKPGFLRMYRRLPLPQIKFNHFLGEKSVIYDFPYLSEDGKNLLVGNHRQSLTLWNLENQSAETTQAVWTYPKIIDDSLIYTMTPDGSKIIVATQTDGVQVFNREDQQLLFEGERGQKNLKIIVSPNSQLMVLLRENGTVILWSLVNGQTKTITNRIGGDGANLAAFSPNANLLFIGYQQGGFELYSLAPLLGKKTLVRGLLSLLSSPMRIDSYWQKKRLDVIMGSIMASEAMPVVSGVRFSSDHRYLLTLFDKAYAVWDLQTKKFLHAEGEPEAEFLGEDPWKVLSWGKEVIHLSNILDRTDEQRLFQPFQKFQKVLLSPNRQQIISFNREDNAKVHRGKLDWVVFELSPSRGADRFFYSPDGQFIAGYFPETQNQSGLENNGHVRIWLSTNGLLLGTISNVHPHSQSAQFTKDSQHFVVRNGDGTIALWDLTEEVDSGY